MVTPPEAPPSTPLSYPCSISLSAHHLKALNLLTLGRKSREDRTSSNSLITDTE